ncbi:hypothetical protein ABQD97_06965 [Enterococcus avium]|uniref:YitT family protein n=1 Tax=Enterococcus avium TaxID=33945 RepID=A0ABD5F8A8_ENTAV|nr:hypothetical protein [Enterococcus avium]MDT2397116.1 hypothetical protein [Enterococcus avium]MDT2435004.1 hypothetical protein [Enterococcus avium]MDT2449257.1 hypothetical protein [Enterococcus avium]MDT2465299.1 hypothetical protein [Enterococcus avium]MDT2469569.1 hypothetical protein [Enterococcus avium]
MNQKKLTLSFLYYLISAFGISLTLKASIGVSSFNSLNATLADFSQIKIGTITAGINFLFLICCVLLDPQRKLKNYLVMSIALLFFGSTINLFTYFIFPLFTLHSYLLKCLLFILGTIIAGIGTGKVLKYQLLKFPIETFCLFLSERTQRSFKFYRYSIDLVCILIALILTITFHLTLTVREGTIISFLLLSPIINLAKD